MKQCLLVVIAAAVAGALGFFAGTRWKTETTPRAGPAAGSRPAATPEHVITKTEPGKGVLVPRDAAIEKFALFGTRAAALSPEQFGQRYADLLTSADSADVLLERAAMLAALDTERAVACYLAWKKRLGVPLQQNSQEIRHLLTVAGERGGANIIAAMQKAAPGFQELSSLVHGWALKEPAAAVDWYNNLPDDDAQRKTSLDGLMWGLSQRDSATASKVFQSLSPEDQLTSGRSLGRALFTANGGMEVDRLIEGLSPEAALQCLQGACERTFRRAPAETVPWLAAHLGAADSVDQTFVNMWIRWSVTNPAAAEEWRTAASQSNPRIAALMTTAWDPPPSVTVGPAERRK